MTRSVFNHRRGGLVVLSTDSFNRTDNASSVGLTDGLGALGPGILDPLTWNNDSGTWGITSNAIACNTAGNYCTVDLKTPDVDISALGIKNASGNGILFRKQDNTNFWLLRSNGGTLELGKRVANVFTSVATGGTITGTPGRVRIVATGTTMNCYVDNSLKITATGQTSLQTATRGGFVVQVINAQMDDWAALQA